MFLDNSTQIEIRHDEVVIFKGAESVRISHRALEKLFDEAPRLRKMMIVQEMDYENWLENMYQNMVDRK